MFRAPSPMIVRDSLVPREAYAFLRREDFYMCGVSVDKANLCHLVSFSLYTFHLFIGFSYFHFNLIRDQ